MRMRMRMRTRTILTVLGLVVTFTWQVAPVSAHYVAGATGKTGCNRLNIHDLDDAIIGYSRGALTNANHNAVAWVIDNRVKPTNLGAVTASSSVADFRYFDDTYTTYCSKNWWRSPTQGSVIGLATCSSLVADGSCDRHHVYLSETWTDTQGASGRRRLVCHETGHAIGFQHNDHWGNALDSCMRTPLSDSNIYSDHEVDIINSLW